ncbi:hypothetical protein Tco_0837728 [Tanacetum coccineum]
MQEPSESTPTIYLQLPSQVKGQGSKDKGKAKMIELEKPSKKKYQIKFDEEEALRLQAKFDEEDRLAREKAQQVEEANIAWDDIQAKIDADYQLAERLQAQEQQELIIEEKSTLFLQLLKKERSTLLLKEQKKREINHLQKLNKGVLCVMEVQGGTQPIFRCLEALTGKIWKLCGNWLKLRMEDAKWMNLRESKVLVWKLFDSCGVHFVRFQNLHVFMLVEKRYPFTPATITDMLNKKLQAGHLNEMCYQLLKLITKQLKNQ